MLILLSWCERGHILAPIITVHQCYVCGVKTIHRFPPAIQFIVNASVRAGTLASEAIYDTLSADGWPVERRNTRLLTSVDSFYGTMRVHGPWSIIVPNTELAA